METTDLIPQSGQAPSAPAIPGTLMLVASGRDWVRSVALRAGSELVIGRHSSCDLALPEATLSRRHARFLASAAGVTVEDLGSRHGTWLADKRVDSAVLSVGVSVRLAEVMVAVSWSDEVADAVVNDAPALVPEALYVGERMRAVRALLHRLANTELPVAILGETGTGKELAVRELHMASRRSRGPLCVLNCAAIPPHLIESTLFGHERGAFTGADRARAGLFEDARGGTLFLDEVGELSSGAQAALLRVLESRRLRRVGGNSEIDVDVRVVCATHRNLQDMALRGEFRADLLHRLYVVPIELPPLRSRREEIAPLVMHFLAREPAGAQIDPRALARLQEYDWPGNVRELRNVVARAVALARGVCIMEGDLPEALRASASCTPTPHAPAPARARDDAPTLRARMAQFERLEAQRALEQSGGNQRRAAQLLGIPLRTFERRLRAWRDQAGAESGM